MTIEDQQTHRANRSQTDKKELPQGSPVHASEKRLMPTKEIDGPPGLEPTRYGDWEKNGRCIDF
ncbi:MAG: DUF1674 domain-containing protein [Gammaproteobacteria bacterium]|nr:DUF1674 domain-containing protein [Gammaproteobacteria bacterium]NNJ84620.1 DUF1674 domain-containing protein [Gammaproteobacteria bacterium]